jgi:AcrR family transcriptional regulator
VSGAGERDNGDISQRQRILTAAVGVVESDGLATEFTEIARRVGLNTRIVEQHFPDIEALLRALVTQLVDDLTELAESAIQHGGDGLEQYLYGLGDLVYSRRRIVTLARLFPDEQRLRTLRTLSERRAQLLAAAQRHGCIRAGIDRNDVDALVWTMAHLIGEYGSMAPGSWRRWLAISLAGMRSSADAVAGEGPGSQFYDAMFTAYTV